jgi:mannose-6-phosphate isomerase-like protein (cupin superfamily)
MENGVPEAADGVIQKPWGWQKRISKDHKTEVWYGESKLDGGTTSVHRHEHYNQRLIVIEGVVGVVNAPNGFVLQVSPGEWCETAFGERHRLVFPGHAKFIEVYRIGLSAQQMPKDVLEDTVRDDPNRDVFAFG